MITRFLLSVCLLAGLISCTKEPIREFTIIPRPDNVSYQNGFVTLSTNPVIAYDTSLADNASMLKDYLSKDCQMTPSLQEGNKGDIILSIDTVLSDHKEGYIFTAANNKITITANTQSGIMNGIQSLRQALEQKDGKWTVQKATITDYPAFQWRAFMLDEGRYFKGKEVVKELLDQMAILKLNVFHWHLVDDQGWRIEIKKYPKLTEVGAFRDSSEINHFGSDEYDGKPHGGFYTQEDIREIVAYAAQRNIRVVPEIEMPGHSSAAIAAYPWLGTSGKQIKVPGKFGVHYDVYNVADPKVIGFLNDVMDEVITLFPDSVFHIGGDEVKYDQWKKSPMVQKYMKENGLSTPAELQVFFTNNVSNTLAAKGRRMMGWNEITGAKLHEYQDSTDTEVAQQLAPGTIVHFWKGEPEMIKKALLQGYDIVNSYHIYTYLDYDYNSISLRKAYDFDPMPQDLPKSLQKHVLGLGCQMWGEFIPTVESMNKKIYPRIAAFAEVGWTSFGRKDFIVFEHSLKSLEERWKKDNIIIGNEKE